MATIQFKRGTAARWAELNLVLEAGQPGFVTDENRMKIGDGDTAWNDLPYMGEGCVQNYATHLEFPSVGKPNVIYKAESEKTMYQWNETDQQFEKIGGEAGNLDIQVIHGGNAAGE